jgi:hypothetical protein
MKKIMNKLLFYGTIVFEKLSAIQVVTKYFGFYGI